MSGLPSSPSEAAPSVDLVNTRTGFRVIAILLILESATLALVDRYGPAAQQAERLALVQDHASRLEPSVRRLLDSSKHQKIRQM